MRRIRLLILPMLLLLSLSDRAFGQAQQAPEQALKDASSHSGDMPASDRSPSGDKDSTASTSARDAIAAAEDSTASSGQTQIRPVSKIHAVMDVVKTNIKQTFELDPHLKKDLTEGNPALRPIRLMQDYYATGYNPFIEWDRAGGDGTGNAGNPTHVWTTSYDKRNLALYLAGPVTKHLSGWFQMIPLQYPHHFFQHFEMFQGMANYGTEKTFIQIRGGQGFNWQNAGWGGADRTITQTSPGVYSAFNGFDPTAPSKFISLEATGLNWTTGKVFAYWQPAAGTTNSSNITYHKSYGIGFTGEKLIGKTGISGIQTNLTVGNTPVFNANADNATLVAQSVASQNAIANVNAANANLQAQADQASQAAIANDLANGIDPVTAQNDGAAASAAVISNAGGFADPQAAATAASSAVAGNPIGTQSSPFVSWTSWINKSFQDKKGNVRINPSFGLTAFRVRRFLDDASLPPSRSTGYGYTFDLVTIPVTSYWTSILRFDDFRNTDLTHRNATYTFTVGQAVDFHSGNKGRIRVTLDYQLVGQKGLAPSHRIILGFWPIW